MKTSEKRHEGLLRDKRSFWQRQQSMIHCLLAFSVRLIFACRCRSTDELCLNARIEADFTFFYKFCKCNYKWLIAENMYIQCAHAKVIVR